MNLQQIWVTKRVMAPTPAEAIKEAQLMAGQLYQVTSSTVHQQGNVWEVGAWLVAIPDAKEKVDGERKLV